MLKSCFPPSVCNRFSVPESNFSKANSKVIQKFLNVITLVPSCQIPHLMFPISFSSLHQRFPRFGILVILLQTSSCGEAWPQFMKTSCSICSKRNLWGKDGSQFPPTLPTEFRSTLSKQNSRAFQQLPYQHWRMSMTYPSIFSVQWSRDRCI